MNDKIKGVFWGVVAAVTYGMNPLFALPLYKAGLNADAVLFYRYLLALLMLGGWMKFRKSSFALKQEEIFPAAMAGLLIAGSSLFLFLSYQVMDAGIASTILFVYPVMVAVIMAVLFHEKVTPATVCSILLALAGVALLCRNGDGTAIGFAGLLMVIASALSYAIYIIAVKQSRLRNLPGDRLTFYALLFGLAVFFVRLNFGLSLPVLPTWGCWGNASALALVTTVISLLATAQAVRCVGATPTAILGALEPVTAVFFGITVFGEQLTFRLTFGILLVIGSVFFIIGGNRFNRLFQAGRR